MNASEESARINRLRQLEERQKLAEVLGVTIPVMPPRNPGETDKDYGVRISWIAKAHCGPPPRPKVKPKSVVKLKRFDPPEEEHGPPLPPVEPEGERLANMMPDYTTNEEEP